MKILSLASARRKTERLMRFESNFSLLLVVSSDIMAMKESNTDYMGRTHYKSAVHAADEGQSSGAV